VIIGLVGLFILFTIALVAFVYGLQLDDFNGAYILNRTRVPVQSYEAKNKYRKSVEGINTTVVNIDVNVKR
jgi:hypothetical protein